MSMQTAQVSIANIDDAEGLDSVMTALKNITGVTAIDLDTAHHIAMVRYDDTQTSIHALTAAISMVDYVTQPFPIDAPQNPHYDDES
ncbi:MAG: heavy-metal-associated domain-containing protein [Psychrobacter sp.]|uniref:heavy-metal-associated domain-containing protein n=1 Tax=unclassified Psychrobacter TaxID=196806 RepID=UPI001787AD09|nr:MULTISPECIES: heavy-metal-associated domain-containing protein [unclassified Psychrobacter]MBE0440702.1 hypothetical protein [Psychrobacter sp. FME13]